MKKVFMMLLLISGLLSCGSEAPTMTVNQMNKLKLGTELGKFINQNSTLKIDYSYVSKYEVNGKEYKVVFTKTIPFEAISEIFMYVVLTFEDEKLSFFGYPFDYRRATSTDLNLLGEKIVKTIRDYESGSLDLDKSFE